MQVIGIVLVVIGCFGLGGWAVWSYITRLGWDETEQDRRDAE